MKTPAKQTRKISKKQKILMAIAGVVIILVGWWSYLNFMPHPLGDKLEYLGKKDFGGGLFFYDHRPYTVYYYGTDMTADEVVAYFKGATLNNPTDLKANNAFELTFSLRSPDTDNPIYIEYYFDGKEYSQTHNLKTAPKQHLITISEEDYDSARKSL
jgi:hypothetical protein